MAISQMIADGLVFSGIIILGSIGLSLVYAIADFPNFAHGDLMTIGAYAAFVINVMIGTNIALGFIVAMVVVGFVAFGTNELIYKPLEGSAIKLLITSIGVALCYRAIIIIVFASDAKTYDAGGRGRIEFIDDLFGVAITPRGMTVILVTILLVGALHVMLQYTTLGRMMRATADNKDLARVSGIRTRHVIVAMWLIGGALAGAGGVFLGLDLIIRPRIGFSILLVLFAAVILGGIGSVYGAMLGGFAIGMSYELSPVLPYITTDYKAAVAFLIMIVILLVRPRGIMGGKTAA